MSELITDIDVVDRNKPVEEENCEVRISKESNSTGKKLYIESYGCQMNFSDSEIVTSILKKEGYDTTAEAEKADVVLLNTCSIREKAELTVSATGVAVEIGIDDSCHQSSTL